MSKRVNYPKKKPKVEPVNAIWEQTLPAPVEPRIWKFSEVAIVWQATVGGKRLARVALRHTEDRTSVLPYDYSKTVLCYVAGNAEWSTGVLVEVQNRHGQPLADADVEGFNNVLQALTDNSK